jgi:hypothetical protein
VASHAEAPANVDPLSCKIMPTPLSPATSSFRSPRAFACCTSSSQSKLDHAASCTATSLSTRPPSGPPQQFREFLMFDHRYHYVIHDRNAIFASGLDTALRGFGVPVKTPVRAPKANAFCECPIGTIRSLMTSNAECENRAAGYLGPTTGAGEVRNGSAAKRRKVLAATF